MGFYREQVLPRMTNVLLQGRELDQIRSRTASGLSGEVLEVGFGSGLNVPFYPSDVHRVRAVDPALTGRKLAAKRVASSAVPIEYVDLDGKRFGIESESVDNVLVTWTLCTIPDVEAALLEMRRVLRAAGQLHFAEHGLSPDPKVARRQSQLTPIQRSWAGGCHLNRPIARLIVGAGFEMSRLDTSYLKGPKSTSYMYEGIAVKP